MINKLNYIHKTLSELITDSNDKITLNESCISLNVLINKYSNDIFEFPYPNYEFREEDNVCIDGDNIGQIIKIVPLGKKFKFTIKFSNNEYKNYIRDTLNCSEDKNFYLHSARWD